MWQLLKSEWNYHRMILLFLITVSMLNFLSIQLYPLYVGKPIIEANAGIISVGNLYFYFIMVLLSLSSRSNRSRHLLSLPVPLWTIGFLRLFFYMSYWIFLVLIYLSFTQISNHYQLNNTTRSILVSQTGIILIVYSTFFIGRDFIKSMNRKKKIGKLTMRQWLAMGFIVLIAIISFITMAGVIQNYQGKSHTQFDRFLTGLYQSEFGTLGLLCTGLLMAALGLSVYTRRASYIE